MDKLILAYGSLREGEYNFERMKNYFGENSIKKIGEHTLQNYSMKDLGSYPAIFPSKAGQVFCDILIVSEECHTFIEKMELGAGYKYNSVLINFTDIEVTPVKFYYIDEKVIKNYPDVISGDWSKYLIINKNQFKNNV